MLFPMHWPRCWIKLWHVLDPKPNEVIFDVCAAPGGKTTHIASLAGDTSIVYGCDIYDHKLQLIEKNAQHLGLSNVRVLLQDAATIGEIYADRADRVLVDAPCSGLGVLKRKLDLRWRKKPMDLKRLPELQLTMLESASKCVKPGGILVYSTCTMNDDENVHVVYDRNQSGGDSITKNISGTGKTRVRVYINNSLVQDKYI